ncbi:hypothetical protein [Chitinimonas naiadis]
MQFKSAEHLLAWTFETLATPIIRISRYEQSVASSGSRPQDYLSKHDKHAQAARVQAYLSTLPVGQKCVLFGLYEPAMRDSAVLALASQVETRFGLQASGYAVRMWLTPQRSQGRTVGSERELARLADTSPSTARRYKNAVWDELDKLRLQGLAAVEKRFVELLARDEVSEIKEEMALA